MIPFAIFLAISLVVNYFYLKKKLKQKIAAIENYKPQIAEQLAQWELTFITCREPSWKESFQSYPFDYIQIGVRVNNQFYGAEDWITLKVVFENKLGKKGETWLQIQRSRLNGKVNFEWQPALIHFQNAASDLKY